ncbi:autophagy-related protein 16-1-like [Teleopsis dalmanni]|uniref:autophagy-related protein 16-1-like n=1 Tax=Teleopsis dalmanni TaxID=139649 RepID=UPI0018CCA8F6|nr:autophagy-related protein 16-1-like [Teleopsis dalmanni]
MFGASTKRPECYGKDCNPTTIFMKFEAHETESHAVRWSPIERMVATGGADRKVKFWDVGKGSSEPRAVLGGSSAGINSVDFDSTGSYILGTSNDYGARVWTVADSRLRVSVDNDNNNNVNFTNNKNVTTNTPSSESDEMDDEFIVVQ